MTINRALIGLENPKSPENVGMVLRAAGCYGADTIFYTGSRFNRAREFYTDTKDWHEKIQLLCVEQLAHANTQGAKIVAVELVEGAQPLMEFIHPEHAFYIFGPEDGSVSQAVLDVCDAVIYIPTIGCMNLAASVNVVLYDRLAKNPAEAIYERPIANNRDNNSKIRIRKPNSLT